MTTFSAGNTDAALVRCKVCGRFGASYGETDPVAAEECLFCYESRWGKPPVAHSQLIRFLKGESDEL